MSRANPTKVCGSCGGRSANGCRSCFHCNAPFEIVGHIAPYTQVMTEKFIVCFHKEIDQIKQKPIGLRK